jgi:hypothetical protein
VYWAYWVGEVDGPQRSDAFMAGTGLETFGGATLLKHLTDRLNPSLGYLEMTTHTVWSLLQVKRHLLEDQPATARVLSDRVGALLDDDQVGDRAREEMNGVRYALRLAGHH